MVTEGQNVHRGQLILSLNAADIQSQLAQARQDLLSAQTILQNARAGGPPNEVAQLGGDLQKAQAQVANLERTQAALTELVTKQAATQDELAKNQEALDEARANLQAFEQKTAALKKQTNIDAEAAGLRVKQAEGQVQSLEEKLRSATVTAESDGTVYSLPVHANDYVKVGDILAEMADLRQVRVRAFVDEPDLGSLAPDEEVKVSWDAMPNRTWTGKVEQVPKQVVARGTRSVGEVLCSVQNDKVELLPNVNVEVRILVRQRPGVLVVPRRAVSYENGQHYVFVFDGEKIHRRQFEAGVASDKNYEVISGLALGDKIALPGEVELNGRYGSSSHGGQMNRRFPCIPRFSMALFAGMAMLATIGPLAEAVESPSVAASDASGTIQTAQHQFNLGNYAAAIKTLQSVPQVSNNAEAQYWLGRSYYELHDYDNAITASEKSVELDPKNSVYHQWLGTIYGGKADRDRSFSYARKVKKEFEEAIRLNPSNVEARRDLEQYDMEAPWVVGGSKDEAREQVTAIEAIDPVEGHLAHAAYEMNAKKFDLAEKEYREVLAAKPKRVESYFDVIRFFIHENKPADVEATIQAAAQVSPNDPRLVYYRGVSRVLSGTELPRGEEYLKSYLASSPDRSDWPSHAAARVSGWEGFTKRKENVRKRQSNIVPLCNLDPGQKEAKSRLEKLEKSAH